MKKTSSIAAVAMSIFTAVIVVSVVSAYQSTYGFDLNSIGNGVVISASGVGINESLVGKNMGLSAVNLFILNKTFTVSPGLKSLGDLIVPLNLSQLNTMGYPTHNVTLGISILGTLVALFFNLSKNFALGKTVMPAPFDNFTITDLTKNGNGTGMLSIAFNYFLPVLFNIAKIGIMNGPNSIGNISLSNLVPGFNNMTSIIQLPPGLNSLNLSFQAGPLTWSQSNVSLS